MKNVFFSAIMLLTFAIVFTACSGNDTKTKTEKLSNDEMYTCTMHNEVMSDHPGKCPKCDMTLVKQKITADQRKMMNEGTHVKPKQ